MSINVLRHILASSKLIKRTGKQSTFANLAARIDIGERNGGSSPDYRGYKTVAFGPTRLSDAQLIALSGAV